MTHTLPSTANGQELEKLQQMCQEGVRYLSVHVVWCRFSYHIKQESVLSHVSIVQLGMMIPMDDDQECEETDLTWMVIVYTRWISYEPWCIHMYGMDQGSFIKGRGVRRGE